MIESIERDFAELIGRKRFEEMWLASKTSSTHSAGPNAITMANDTTLRKSASVPT